MNIPILITVVALLVLLASEWKGNRAGVWVAKPIASLGFLVAAFTNGTLETRYGTIILVALLLSFAGDVLLIATNRAAFKAGIFSFLLAHVTFSIAFFSRGSDPVRIGFAAVVFGLIGLVMYRWLARHIDLSMLTPVLAYIVAIVTMASSAVAAPVAWFVPLAAVAFVISDVFVSRHRFVQPSFINKLWGLPLYYLAQHLMAMSV